MKEKIKEAIQRYQCPGCINGFDTNCGKYVKYDWSESCGKHHPATSIGLSIKIFLGMPKGFNRTGVGMGDENRLHLDIFESWEKLGEMWGAYDKFNIPVWKHLNKREGHTFVRGLSPRNNTPFLHVILEDCMDKIDCFEVSEEMIKEMD